MNTTENEILETSLIATENKVGESELDKSKRIKSLFGMNDALNSIKGLANEMIVQRESVLGEGSEEVSKILVAALANKTADEIKAMTDEEVNALFVDESGGEIELTFKTKNDTEATAFKRNFLTFMKESEYALEQIDTETKRLEDELADSQEELKEIIESFGSFNNYIKSALKTQLENETDPDVREKLLLSQKAYDDATTLDNIFEYVSSINRANVLGDLKSQTRSQKIYDKYKAQMVKLKIQTDLADFNNLELALDEKYHDIANVFLFTVMKYFAYKKEVSITYDGVFIAQLGVHVRDVLSGKPDSPEDAETFKANLARVLDLFI